ncbi:fungal-specific transcription factor domain-containing protein [Xylariaceae sp. FL1651]|nr:fungal-specific transcription factor domain-containing protein [Xylariaceae sp. FL1651]
MNLAEATIAMDSPIERPRQQPGHACEACRKKRIRCDRGAPKCAACATSGSVCVVKITRPPRGPKKGYIQALRKKIDDLQILLNKQQEEGGGAAVENAIESTSPHLISYAEANENDGSSVDQSSDTQLVDNDMPPDSHYPRSDSVHPQPTPVTVGSSLLNLPYFWEGPESLQASLAFPAVDHLQPQLFLETDAPLTPIVRKDLDLLFFDRVHAFAPVVQGHRYRAWSGRPDKSKQRVCLQYAMWTLASSFSSQFRDIRDSLYHEARQRLDDLESDKTQQTWLESDLNAYSISIEQVQAWVLLALYELTSDTSNYQRGIISAGRAFRMVQMRRLHDIDRFDQDLTCPHGQAQGDWIDIESMRRTFWLAYTIDRFTSVVDSLHLVFDEQQIRTRMPAPDAYFASGQPITMCFLSDMMNDDVQAEWNTVSPFAGCVVVATLCGRALQHQQGVPVRHPPRRHQPQQQPKRRQQHCLEQDGDAVYDFCCRHRLLHALLAQHAKMLRTQFSSPLEHPNMAPDPVYTFVALAACMAVFILHGTAESNAIGSGAQATQLIDALLAEHRQYSLDAVREISALVTVVSQQSHFQLARTFLQLLGFDPGTSPVG